MHPKHAKGLSDGALNCSGMQLRTFELTSRWPKCEQAVLTALIPKSDGGLRPIALFRAAYRVYGKANARQVRAWAAILPDHQCNISKGRWVGDSI